MRNILCAVLIAFYAIPAAAQLRASQLGEDEAAFRELASLYENTPDRAAVIEGLEKFIGKYSKSERVPDARFMQAEARLARGLELLRREKNSGTSAGKAAGNATAQTAAAVLNSAAEAYVSVIGNYSRSGLDASAQYRIAEVYYSLGDWEHALKEFLKTESKYPDSYIVPESMLGAVYTNIAAGRIKEAQAGLAGLEETCPACARGPAAIFAAGVIELTRRNYEAAEKRFSQLDSPEARLFLGKTYLQGDKPYLAAAVFEKLLKDLPGADFGEEARFLAADAFFRAGDYDSAIGKFKDFLGDYSASRLRGAAAYRIGAALFGKKDYSGARSAFQEVLDKNPLDFLAPYAQFFIAESYLENKQAREALLAYTKAAAAYGDSAVGPASSYKLAWCQYLLEEYQQALHTLENFLLLYPSHALAGHAYYLKGTTLLELGRTDEGLRAFQGVVDLAPAGEMAEQALFLMLRAEYDRGNFNGILTSYQFILKRLPAARSKWRALSLLYVAEAYMAVNLTDDARGIYAAITGTYPGDMAALHAQEGLVWCLALAGDTQGADRAREKLKTLKTQFPEAQQPAGADAVALADGNFNRKEFEKAYQLYEAFAAENPKAAQAPAALYRAGLALYRLRYYSQAVETWSRLSRAYPQAPETELADFQTADTWFRAQKYAEASGAYERLVSKYPASDKLPLALLRLGQVRYNLKQDAQALERAKSVVAGYPDAPEAADAFDLAEAVFDRGPALDVKTWLEGLAGRQPADKTSGEALFRLGRRLFEKKDYAVAAASLKKFSADYMDHPAVKDAQFYLGEAYFQTGDMENAVSVFERFTLNYREAKEHPVALFRLGNAWYNLNDHKNASRAYAELAGLYPKSEYVKPALFNLAMCYKSAGDADKAEETYRKYSELAGSADAAAAQWEIFNMRKARGDLTGALKTLTQISGAAKSGEDALEAMYYMGELSLEARRPDAARKYWEQLSRGQPASNAWRLQGLVKLGELYEAEKNYREAARVYGDIARNSDKPEVAKAAAGRAKSLPGMAAAPEQNSAGNAADSGAGPGTEAGDGAAAANGAGEAAGEAANKVSAHEELEPAPVKKKVRRKKKKPAVPEARR